MIKHTLKNDYLTITVNELGAELSSIRNNLSQQEYLWNADPAYWKRHSPILFPIVGGLKNKEYTYNNKTYPMGQHGFARDMEFELIKKEEHELVFSLSSNEATYQVYPFLFELQIGYQLVDEKIIVSWNVKNTDTKTMYFSIGGHPAFLCPLHENENQSDYSLLFDTTKLNVTNINTNGLAIDTKKHMTLENGYLPISKHLFDEDALVIEHNQAHRVSLVTPDKTPYVTVRFDAPLFGIWSPAQKNAPFVCIEPWYGRCDHQTFEGTLKEREWGNSLTPNEVFEASYEIEINGGSNHE